jgi:hypothetical protein
MAKGKKYAVGGAEGFIALCTTRKEAEDLAKRAAQNLYRESLKNSGGSPKIVPMFTWVLQIEGVMMTLVRVYGTDRGITSKTPGKTFKMKPGDHGLRLFKP